MQRNSIDAAAVHNGRRIELTLALDSGQMVSCLPGPVWRRLNLVRQRDLPVSSTDGRTRSRPAGVCIIETEFGAVETPVLLGGEGDAGVLGTLTLSELGLAFDPKARTLKPGVFPMMRGAAEVLA